MNNKLSLSVQDTYQKIALMLIGNRPNTNSRYCHYVTSQYIKKIPEVDRGNFYIVMVGMDSDAVVHSLVVSKSGTIVSGGKPGDRIENGIYYNDSQWANMEVISAMSVSKFFEKYPWSDPVKSVELTSKVEADIASEEKPVDREMMISAIDQWLESDADVADLPEAVSYMAKQAGIDPKKYNSFQELLDKFSDYDLSILYNRCVHQGMPEPAPKSSNRNSYSYKADLVKRVSKDPAKMAILAKLLSQQPKIKQARYPGAKAIWNLSPENYELFLQEIGE